MTLHNSVSCLMHRFFPQFPSNKQGNHLGILQAAIVCGGASGFFSLILRVLRCIYGPCISSLHSSWKFIRGCSQFMCLWIGYCIKCI